MISIIQHNHIERWMTSRHTRDSKLLTIYRISYCRLIISNHWCQKWSSMITLPNIPHSHQHTKHQYSYPRLSTTLHDIVIHILKTHSTHENKKRSHQSNTHYLLKSVKTIANMCFYYVDGLQKSELDESPHEDHEDNRGSHDLQPPPQHGQMQVWGY